MLEPLESRRLLSLSLWGQSVTLNEGVLSIEGTFWNDHILVTREPLQQTCTVLMNGVDYKFDLGNVDLVRINAGAGDDHVQMFDVSIWWAYANTHSVAPADPVWAPVEMDGGTGRDTLKGGSSNDTLLGGTGNDSLYGQGGDNELYGGRGDDTLDGQFGNDLLSGGVGNDTADYRFQGFTMEISLDGIANDIAFRASKGSDERNILETDNVLPDVENVITGHGGDLIIGSAAANRLEGGWGQDTIYGQGGDDTLVGGEGGDLFSGGDGTDTVSYADHRTAVYVTIDGIRNDGTPRSSLKSLEKDNVLTDVENLWGTFGNDILSGSDAANVLDGGMGRDTLIGGDDADLLSGGRGKDWLIGGLGSDDLQGGPGNDTADYADAWHAGGVTVTIDGVANDGTIFHPVIDQVGAPSTSESDNVHLDVENVRGSAGNDHITGSAGSNALLGMAGHDILIGGPGMDLLDGGSGDDIFRAQDGFVDRLYGGTGEDGGDTDSEDHQLDIESFFVIASRYSSTSSR